MLAAVDSLWLMGSIYNLLKKNFHHEPYYTDLLELFHSVSNELHEVCKKATIIVYFFGISVFQSVHLCIYVMFVYLYYIYDVFMCFSRFAMKV